MNEDILNIWVYVHDQATKGIDSIRQKMKGLDQDVKNSAKSMDGHSSAAQKADKMAADLAKQWENLAGEARGLGKEIDNTTEKLDKHEKQTRKTEGSTRSLVAAFGGLKIVLIGIALAPLLDGLIQLGGLLVTVAASAGAAAAALGGAFVAGIAQAVPALGLLTVAFKKLTDIIQLVNQQTKIQQDSALTASARSLQHAQQLQSEARAHLAVADAQKQLIIARRDAIRQIQDMNAAEKAAYLTSQQATLGLIGSKAALSNLEASGGSALDIANAQASVSASQQGVQQAGVGLSRARQDAARVRRQGVAGNPNVVQASRQVTQTQQDLVMQQREFAEANKNAISGLNEFNAALKRLDPAQRRLFDAIVKLKNEFNADWKGITDPIINAFTTVVDSITKMLKDPDIQAAFKGLSEGLGSAIKTIAGAFTSTEGQKLFIQILKDGKENLPLIANILKTVFTLFGQIAVGAGPLLHNILTGINGFFTSFEGKASSRKAVKDFFTDAGKALSLWVNVGKGLIGIFSALVSNGGLKTGNDLVKNLGDFLNHLAAELRDNKTAVGDFFDRLGTTVKLLGGFLSDVGGALLDIEKTGAFDGLIKLLDNVFLPLIKNVLIVMGKIISALGEFSGTKYGGPILEVAAAFGGIFLAVSKISKAVDGLKPVFDNAGKVITAFKKLFIVAQVEEAAATEEAAAAEAAAFAITPWGLVILGILAIIAAIVLLDRKFHFLKPTFEWLKGAFFDTINYIKDHWKAILLLFGPVGLAIRELVVHFDSIRAAAVELKNKLTPIFDFIVKYIVEPLYKDGIKPIFDVIKDIVAYLNGGSIDNAFSAAFNAVIKVAKDALAVIEKIYGVAKKIVDIAKDANPFGHGRSADPGFVGNRGTAGLGVGGSAGSGTGSGSGSGGSISAALGSNPLQSGTGGFTTSNGGITAGAASGKINAGSAGGGNDDIAPSTVGGDDKKKTELARRAQAIADVMDNMPRTDSTGKKIRGYPYAWGGGHGAIGQPSKAFRKVNSVTHALETGFDCSGAVSAVLGAIGALANPLTSGGFANWGKPASGNEPIVVHYNNDHVWMTILGQDYSTGTGDDSGFGRGNIGTTGYKMRTLPAFAEGGEVPGQPSKGDSVAAWLTPGEIVLNAMHQKMLGGKAFLIDYLKLKSHSGPFAPGGNVIAPVARPGTSSGSRGGAAVAPGSIGHAVKYITDFTTATIYDAIDVAKDAYKSFRAGGSYNSTIVKAFTGIDSVLSQMANTAVAAASKFTQKIVATRYRVNGASRNTSVVDQSGDGSGVTDATNNLYGLGLARDQLLAQSQAAQAAVVEAQREANKTKDPVKKKQLLGIMAGYQDKVRQFGDQLAQNVLDIVAAQNALITAQVDKINDTANRAINGSQFQQHIAELTGAGKGNIPFFIQGQINALQAQKDALYNGPLQAAVNQGNVALYNQIVDQMTAIDGAIADAVHARFESILSAVDEISQQEDTATSIRTRLNALGGNSFKSLSGTGSLLQQRQADLQDQIFRTTQAGFSATSPAETLEIKQRLDELNTQLAENSDAIRQNSEDIKSAQVDRINASAQFQGGVNTGIGGLLQSIATQTGAFNSPDYLRSLEGQKKNLDTQGTDLRSQLGSQFGIQLSSDPTQLVNQLQNTDFRAIEFGMDDTTKSTFENLINSILSNSQANVDNTTAINQANGQLMTQDWASTSWTQFRQALFDGNSNLLSAIPQAATGAHIQAAGLLRVHSGETVIPATVSPFTSSPVNINIPIDNRGEGDVDTLALTKRLAFEMKTRN